MRTLTAVALAGLVSLGIGVSAQARFKDPYTQHLERRVAWQDQHIRQLNHRRAYLHRYIRHLRHPQPTYTASGGWADELRAVGFPDSSISTMLAIIQRESGGNPNAVNPSSGACGLTQLYPCYGGSAWLDPMTNLRIAFQKYQASGFAPWGG